LVKNIDIQEKTLRWDPIPEFANREPAVDVVHLEERRVGHQEVVVAVASSWTDPDTNQRVFGAWQLTFSGVFAFRMRSVGYEGNLPLTKPAHQAALWELLPSYYLYENSAPDGHMDDGYHVHHYVIMGWELYEFIATGFTVAPLPAEWARPFAYRVPDSTPYPPDQSTQ
jgi:hypothetical protein